MDDVYDLVGIGFGPANIALAALLDETRPFERCLFLERSGEPMWQSEMLFENALDIHSNVQNIPHRDLATLRSPRSRYTFMNYLHETGRLLPYLNMDLLLPMRPDYAAYVRWVADQLSHFSRTGVAVDSIAVEETGGSYLYRIEAADRAYKARHIVLGTGRPPSIPRVFQEHAASERIFHLNRYKTASRALLAKGARKFAVVGSSQSAVEIVLHLTKVEPSLEVHSIFRRFGYPLKDTNPFMSEIYFPEFTSMFYEADANLKRMINRDVTRTNYGACDMDVLEELYRQIYYDNLNKRNKVQVRRMSEVVSVQYDAEGVSIELRDNIKNVVDREVYDGVILATGFRNIGPGENDVCVPPLLDGLAELFDLDDDGCIKVSRDYAVLKKPTYRRAGEVVLNGLCEATHGMGDAGSLSLLAPRAMTIARALLEHERPTRQTAA